MIRPEEMERHIRFLAHDPTIVRHRRNIEEFSRVHFDHAPIIESCRRYTREHHADMFNMTASSAKRFADVLAPAPTRLISSATDRHAAEVDDFKLTFHQLSRLIGRLETLQDDIEVF